MESHADRRGLQVFPPSERQHCEEEEQRPVDSNWTTNTTQGHTCLDFSCSDDPEGTKWTQEEGPLQVIKGQVLQGPWFTGLEHTGHSPCEEEENQKVSKNN